jgi:hypothetical protein
VYLRIRHASVIQLPVLWSKLNQQSRFLLKYIAQMMAIRILWLSVLPKLVIQVTVLQKVGGQAVNPLSDNSEPVVWFSCKINKRNIECSCSQRAINTHFLCNRDNFPVSSPCSDLLCYFQERMWFFYSTVMRHITTFRSTSDRIYDGGLVRL